MADTLVRVALWILLAVPAVALAALPGAPTGVVALPRDGAAVIHLAPPVSDGGQPITSYTVTASPGGASATAASWPLTVAGLVNGATYTFTARANNASGAGPASSASVGIVPAPATITANVSSAESFTLALDAHGQVYAWGSDANGELGQGRTLTQPSPIQVPGLPSIKFISSFDQVIAVDTTGQLWSWGDGICPHLGPRESSVGSRPSRIVGSTGFATVAAGYCESYGLKPDGTVWKLQSLGNIQVPFPAGIVEIAARGNHVLARRSDGTVWASGLNTSGQLGQGHTNPVAGVVQVPGIANATALSAGLSNSAALLATGEIFFWGDFGPAKYLTATALAGLGGPAVSVSVSVSVVIAARNDGTMWQWVGAPSAPSQVTGMAALAKVHVSQGARFGITAAGALLGNGGNNDGQLGQGNLNPIPGTVAVPGFSTGTTSVTMNMFDGEVLALKADGSVWFWGANSAGQRGDGVAIGSSVPLAVPIPATIKAISTGYRSAAAVDTQGRLWGWGENSGTFDATGVSRSTPQLVPGFTDLAQVSREVDFLVAYTKTDGTAWIARSGVSQQVAGLANITGVASSNGASFFLRGDGVLFGLGNNSFGQMGNGSTTDVATATAVTGLTGTVRKIAIAFFHVAALMTDGRVYVWGADFGGQDFTGGIRRPVLLAGIADAQDIALDNTFGFLRRADGSIYRWSSQAGTVTTPILFPGRPLSKAFASAAFAQYYVGPTGLVFGEGQNRPGTIRTIVGDGTYVARNSPVVVLAHAGSGGIDANNWYLDLEPATPETIPAALVPKALATARSSGGTAVLGLDGTMRYKQADLGKRVNNYVFGLVPPAFFAQVKSAKSLSSMEALKAKAAKANGFVLAQLTPAGWTDVNGQLIAYSQGVASAAGGAANILNGINASAYAGSRFCIGYGETADAMLSSQSLREVLALEGTGAVDSGVPCVLSGVYVNGPVGSTAGSPVSFTASVVGLDPGGNVQFLDGFANLGTLPLARLNPAISTATYGTSSLAVGTHAISALYAGDTQNLPASTPIPVLHVVMAPQATTHVDLSGPVSSGASDEVTFIATVSGNQPGGSIQFRDNGVDLGPSIPVIGSNAVLRAGPLALGVHAITAVYSGDANNSPSTSAALTHQVVAALGTQVVLSLTAGANAGIGTLATMTAVVIGTTPTPQGTVRFFDYAAEFGGPVTLVNGQAQFATSAFAAGTHVVTAVYSGDANNPPVTSPAVVYEVPLKVDPAQGALDSDGDGMSNAVEALEGRNPFTKDNDIFADARLFSMQQYRDFLAREADAGGLAFWTQQVATGAQTRGRAIENFFSSAEFQGSIAPVARLYFAYFLRIPDYGGLNFWIGSFKSGNPLGEISQSFALSPEFSTRYGSLDNGQFVDLVYQNVLGRAPDAPGRAFWKSQLDAGAMNRGAVMLGFSESDEYKAAILNEVYVTMMYMGMLRRAADAPGFSFWVQYKDAGNSGLALIEGFLAAPEYRARFLP